MEFCIDFDKIHEIFDLIIQAFIYGWQWYLGLLIFIVFNIFMCVLHSFLFKGEKDE